MGPSECLGGIWEINFSQPPRGGAVRRVLAVRASTSSRSGTGEASPLISDLQVNRQASLCDEFGGAQSSR